MHTNIMKFFDKNSFKNLKLLPNCLSKTPKMINNNKDSHQFWMDFYFLRGHTIWTSYIFSVSVTPRCWPLTRADLCCLTPPQDTGILHAGPPVVRWYQRVCILASSVSRRHWSPKEAHALLLFSFSRNFPKVSNRES